jgi:hypothetical protein
MLNVAMVTMMVGTRNQWTIAPLKRPINTPMTAAAAKAR